MKQKYRNQSIYILKCTFYFIVVYLYKQMKSFFKISESFFELDTFSKNNMQ